MRYFILLIAICMVACQQQTGQGAAQGTATEILMILRKLCKNNYQANSLCWFIAGVVAEV